jgi:poly-gamma-glutamate synthesis protein (capsule biosynthesis protein)
MNFLLPLIFTLLPFTSWYDSKVDLVFAGDAMQHSAQIEAASNGDGTYSYDEYFAAIKPYIENADYAVVNLETPLGGKPYTGYPCFSAPESYLTALTDAGFDLMLAANNHTLDRRDKGVLQTISQFEKQETDFIGIYRNAEHRSTHLPFIKNINGINIAFLNYTYGTNGITIQGNVVVDYIDKDIIKKDIANARKKGAELIAVCVHWGNEYQLLPHSSQKELADFLCKQGVDLIIGGHPHVIQPMEMRYNELTQKNTLLVYSLGNFISNMKTRDTRGGAMLKVSLSRDINGQAQVDSASYRLVFTIPPTGNNDNFRLVPVEKYHSGSWASQCQAFTKAAEDIFNKHNINVPRDTTTIIDNKNNFQLKNIAKDIANSKNCSTFAPLKTKW